MKQDLTEEIEIPQGVTVTVKDGVFTAKGAKGEVVKIFNNPRITGKTENNTIVLQAKSASQREKKLLMTYKAHLQVILHGAAKGHTYKLKVCASHFPMTVSVKGNTLEIKNFFGEQVPRLVEIKKGASIKIDGQFIILEGVDKELVSQAAALIEQATKRPGFDKRIFQDGIYIVEKDGKAVK